MKNKTKFLLISALSLCTLSAGVTAVMASADDTQTQTAPTFTFAGTSIRLNEEAGIRFGVQMSVADWEAYSEELAETWITISYEDKTSEKIPTSNAWYTVDAEGKYVAENFVAYQSTVV